MLEVCLLGTGGMMPLPYRWLTSLMVRTGGASILIDCGEGTQIAMKKKGWSPKPIDVILFTHYHADHIAGLPGLLLSMANAERTEPVLMAGPKGLEKVVSSLRVIAPELPFEIRYHELSAKTETLTFPENTALKPVTVTAFHVNHRVPCYGYSVALSRTGRFDADAARALGIPLRFWNPLQKGNTVTDPETGKIFTPDMVLGSARKGLKVTYTTDTRPCASIAENAKGSDLFICEGMYGDPEKKANALEHRHMMIEEAGKLAKDAGVRELWLTHYSPSLLHPEEYLPEIRTIFPNTVAARDGRSVDLVFEEES